MVHQNGAGNGAVSRLRRLPPLTEITDEHSHHLSNQLAFHRL
jgi:hypothetical protein